MLTGLLIVLPLLAGTLLLFTKGNVSRNFALAFSILEFILALFSWVQFKHNPEHALLSLDCTWIQSLGVKFSVGIDSMSLLMVLLTTFLVPLIIYSSFQNTYERSNVFYSLILFMQMALVGVFVANDGFLFYVFWELALIPIYFICLLWGGNDRARITFKFFVYTLLGSLFMLVGLIYLHSHTEMVTGEKSWALADLYAAGQKMNVSQQSAVFWLLFIAFAIKMPVFPLHTWQPDTYVNAPTQGTMLLSGIMLKMGTFGMIKWLMPVCPLGVEEWGSTAMIMAVIGIVYASCIAIVQKDYKRLIAYSSIAHVGLIAAGIIAFSQQGIQGALMQMIAHGINVVALFLIADILLRQTGTRELEKLGGIRNVNPFFAVLFLIVVLGVVALPLTNGFVGEFLLITGVYSYGAWVAGVAGLTIILGAVYMLRSYQSIMLGETNSTTSGFSKLAGSDKVILVILCAVILLSGVYPKPLNDLAENAAQTVLMNLK